MNDKAIRRNCVRQAKRQFRQFCLEIDSSNRKRSVRFVDFPLPLIINSGCCVHNVLYTLPCGSCKRSKRDVERNIHP
jgi:hypothetical protein